MCRNVLDEDVLVSTRVAIPVMFIDHGSNVFRVYSVNEHTTTTIDR